MRKRFRSEHWEDRLVTQTLISYWITLVFFSSSHSVVLLFLPSGPPLLSQPFFRMTKTSVSQYPVHKWFFLVPQSCSVVCICGCTWITHPDRQSNSCTHERLWYIVLADMILGFKPMEKCFHSLLYSGYKVCSTNWPADHLSQQCIWPYRCRRPNTKAGWISTFRPWWGHSLIY